MRTMEIEEGVYQIRNVNSGKVADVKGESKDSGANVHQWEDWDDPGNQQFAFEDQGNGRYRITAQHSGLVLTADGGQYGNLIQDEWNGSDAQLWTLEEVADGEYRIDNVGTGQTLDVAWASTENGANICLYHWHGGDNQRWQLTSV